MAELMVRMINQKLEIMIWYMIGQFAADFHHHDESGVKTDTKDDIPFEHT